MRIVSQAKPLAAALGMAASLIDRKLKIPALWHARITASDEGISITANVSDFALKVPLPVAVDLAGEIAIPSEKLAALVAGFPGDATIAIRGDDKGAAISCGSSRFRLPVLPIADLPLMPVITSEVGRAELTREAMLSLVARIGFAISTETTRYYLNGIFLHDVDGGLVATATDGHQLARVVLPGIKGLSADRRLIIPHAAVEVLVRLLRDKAIDTVTIRRSSSLAEFATNGRFTFITKLIDGEFPAYERAIPEPSGNNVVVDRVLLTQAAVRVKAVSPHMARAPLIGLAWVAPGQTLHVAVPGWPNLACDEIAAEVNGKGCVCCQIQHLNQLLDNFEGDRIALDTASDQAPIRVSDPTDPNFLAIQMPCVPPLERAETAA